MEFRLGTIQRVACSTRKSEYAQSLHESGQAPCEPGKIRSCDRRVSKCPAVCTKQQLRSDPAGGLHQRLACDWRSLLEHAQLQRSGAVVVESASHPKEIRTSVGSDTGPGSPKDKGAGG